MSGKVKLSKRGLAGRCFDVLFPDPVVQLLGDKPLADSIRGRQHAHVKSFSPLMLLTNLVCLISVVPVLASFAEFWLVGAWAGLLLVLAFLWARSLGFKLNSSGIVRPRKSTNSLTINAMALSFVWALLPILFFKDAPTDQKVFITCMVSGMMGGATMTLASIPVAARAFCWIIALGAFTTFFSMGGITYISASVLLLAYAVALSRMSWAVGERFVYRYVDLDELEEQRSTIGMLLKDFEDSSSDWMWQTDANGLIVSPSERFCESVGMSQIQLEGKPFKNLVSFNQPSGSSERDKKPLENKLVTALVFRDHDLLMETSNGPRWWNLTGKPIVDGDGILTGFRGTASDVQSAKNAEEKLDRMARYDRVTGLRNRVHLHEAMTERVSAGQSGWGMIVLDLDGFKSVNSSLGHRFGDALLREVGSRLETCLTSDDCAARLSADQFCVLIGNVGALSEATKLAQTIQNQLGRPFIISGHTVSMTSSLGLALHQEGEHDVEAVLRQADLAMVRAKAAGGDTQVVFEKGMDEAMNARRSLERELREAVRDHQFVLYYQAVTDARTGGICAFEALLRWNHPTKGMIEPHEFLPLAEETGLIVDLGEWVLKTACADAVNWAIPHRVAVNVSGKQVMSQRLLLQVIKTLDLTGLPAERLELEVTESVLVENPERTRALFAELRKLGVSISLDDFGTGYSSLADLVRFPFDKVKIHKSFIQQVEESKEAVLIVRSILSLAKNLDIRTIAGGIENEAQLNLAVEEGCHELQGFMIDAPKPMAEIPALAPGQMSRLKRGADQRAVRSDVA